MLDINMISKACVKLDGYADCIPVVSSATNLIDLFLKYVFRPCVGQARLENSHYFAYLEGKTGARSVILLIPVVGNVLIALLDHSSAKDAKYYEALAKQSTSYDAVVFYLKATQRGSIEGGYEVGSSLLSGDRGVNQNTERARVYLRFAAARGHGGAQEALGRLPPR